MKSIVQNTEDSFEKLYAKVKVLSEVSWKDKWEYGTDLLNPWLNNFAEDERTDALFLLSKFMYFDNDAIRELAKRIYEDLFQRPIIHGIRKKYNHSLNFSQITTEYKSVLSRTRFLSLGSPSESSTHLLYYFRQENDLLPELFIDPSLLFTYHRNIEGKMEPTLSFEKIDHLVIIDDFCGSGSQASIFDRDTVKMIKELYPNVTVEYLCMFAIESGLENLRSLHYDKVESIFILDETYKCFSADSRFFGVDDEAIKQRCFDICKKYGPILEPHYSMGFRDCQMLIGFHHNTPNNTLPIFWSENNDWKPAFKRFEKKYK